MRLGESACSCIRVPVPKNLSAHSKNLGIADFALECVRTTKGWSRYWVNDRIMPRRPFEHQPQARKIDAVLEQAIPQYLKARVIE